MAPTFENSAWGRTNVLRRPDGAGQPGDRRGQSHHRERSQQPLAPYRAMSTYYVGVALTATGADGKPMHLPDVAPYWRGSES